MQTGLFIRGGWAPLHKQERNRAGLPSPFGFGPFYFRFPIAEKHTAYEWAMALADRHPYAHPIASLYGSDDLQAETIAGMEARERAIDDNQQAAGIYRELKADVEDRTLHPLRTERCLARPGIDPPNLLDFTRNVFGLDQVLPLIRRRGDTGWLIGKLLARFPTDATPVGARLVPGPEADQANRQAMAGPTIGPDYRTRKRGPKPAKRVATEAVMRERIKAEEETPDKLASLKEVALSAEYGVSRDTARKARNNVLSEFSAQKLRQTPTNDK